MVEPLESSGLIDSYLLPFMLLYQRLTLITPRTKPHSIHSSLPIRYRSYRHHPRALTRYRSLTTLFACYPSLTFSCQQILTSNQPSTQDSHGCPFRHFSPDSLSSFLIQTYPHSFDRSSQELREVMDQVKSTHYHLACTRVFEVVKGVKKGEGLGGENVVHPNKWVDASRAMEKYVLSLPHLNL
jgi:hypothetical protein